ncbi:MAG: type II toxin-antitoxin system antitoxin SocA domain-containing protein, partial [Mangrovibacterium sp.]
PSAVYDGIKAIDDKRYNFEIFRKSLISRGMFILPNADPDMDELSESEIKCLNRSIDENDPLTFDQLVDKSHALAWNKACRDGKMSVKHIAAEGGASKDVIDTIVDNLQDFELSQKYGLVR